MKASDYNANNFEHSVMTIEGPPVVREKGMQESDLLDLMPDGKAAENSGTEHIMLVSLGCFCGPKLSFKHIGRGSETLPFDWMRTRSSGLLHFMRNDFDGFFDFMTKKPVPGCNMTTYRNYYHSFWHDDPSDPGMLERYGRRIKRFQAIDASEKQVLFVRTCASTSEIPEVPELLAELQKRHGRHACLLLIIDFQWTAKGAAIVDGFENLLVYYLSGDHHTGADGNPTPPYAKPVLFALDWMIGKPIGAMSFSGIDKILECADETHWGIQGLGGLLAFEESKEGPQDVLPASDDATRHVPALPPPLPSGELEARVLAEAAPDDGVTCVSLGCSEATKQTLQRMGRGSKALPFDWLRLSHEGLLHFLRKGFEAPIRESLGAGGQRPSERVGYFDVASRRRVPGTDLTMCRSHLHSFWHDDVAQPQTREELQVRLDNWSALRGGNQALLFVRAVASTAEVARADELLGALSREFGASAAGLLLVVDFQKTSPGAYAVEGYDDLLVYFLDSSAHQGAEAQDPYRRPVEVALDWLQGNPLEASCVADLPTLASLADETSWGLAGLAGLRAFEGSRVSEAETDAPTKGRPDAENAWLEAARTEAAKEAIAFVPLGWNPATALAIERLNLPMEASPFLEVRARLEGVIHFLRTDFNDFFDVVTTQKVPGTDLTMRRSYYHSFWEEGSGKETRAAHERSIESFGQLARSGRPKLFVHAAASAEELGMVGDLYKELADRFVAGHVCLLVIVCGQAQPRLLSVEGNYCVVVQFITEDAAAAADGQAFCEPIRKSLDWAVGKPVAASVVADFAALKELAEKTDPLCGPGGLRFFEEGSGGESLGGA